MPTAATVRGRAGVVRAIDTRILGGNVSVVTVIFLLCVVVAWIVLARHRWGR